MQTQDGVTDVQRDPVFLAEHKLLDKASPLIKLQLPGFAKALLYCTMLLLSLMMSLQTVADKMAPGSGAAYFTAVFADSNVPINLYSEFSVRHCWTFGAFLFAVQQ